MEPTIYKPSIYKGAGIYKAGAEGGGCVEFNFFYERIGQKKYLCRKIGNIAVTCENIKELVSGISLNPEEVTETPAAWFYNYGNDEIFENAGLLYNAYALPLLSFGDWHVITNSEMEYILSFLSSSKNALALKSNSENWINSTGIDLIGLSYEPAGRRSPDGAFDSLNYYSNNWTATQKDSVSNYAFTLSYNTDNFTIGGATFRQGYSVRLVKSIT